MITCEERKWVEVEKDEAKMENFLYGGTIMLMIPAERSLEDCRDGKFIEV